ncbi:MAG TPA: hypothetical protein VIV15_07720 [Anaerolineales bacterium]
MKIQLLYFTGCPSWQQAIGNLEAALKEEDITAEPELIRVDSESEADRLKFLGSPHFRVNGVDLWPEKRDQYALNCRLYPTPEGMRGVPTVPMIVQQLRGFKEA